MPTQTTILCILDGLGLNPNSHGNAVTQAKTPVLDNLLNNFPNTTLTTHGERVGLPRDQMGNSEVGHLNIGAGRVVEQWLLMIAKAFEQKKHLSNQSFTNFVSSNTKTKQIHLVGLFSYGGVHSDAAHLYLLLEALLESTTADLCLHLISDGRDVSPNTLISDIEKLCQYAKLNPRIKILTLQGRFFAMDRDARWDRVEKAYNNIIGLNKASTTSIHQYIQSAYAAGITDEFIEPVTFHNFKIEGDDTFLFWNFRADRMREIVSCLCLKEFNNFERKHIIPARNQVLCFANYSNEFKLPYLFAQVAIENYLGQVVANNGLRQLRIAETEKYPHVTYFLNGGSETTLTGEERVLIPSPRDVKTYDQKPEMSALAVKEAVLSGIASGKFQLIVVNFANCDMVGHTGVLEAAIKAVETVDGCLGEILSASQINNLNLLIIADHGNAEQMINYENNTPHTAHTTFPVPCILVSPKSAKLRSGGALCDVAPTILELMELTQPKEMTGKSLLE